MKPKVFVGSSVEGLGVAEAIEQNLQHKFDVTLWTSGVFNLGDVALDNLLEELGRNDFGIFVFSADDASIIRGTQYSTVRDNVLYELGLYTGRLGRFNTFVVKPSATQFEFHLPTDLSGVYLGSYDILKDNYQSAVSVFCGQVKSQVFSSKYPYGGEWVFTWMVEGSENYPDPVIDEVSVFNYRNIIKFIHTIKTKKGEQKYIINAELSNQCLTGTWRGINGVRYDGVFQMTSSGSGAEFEGVWCGWGKNGINSGPCSLVRKPVVQE